MTNEQILKQAIEKAVKNGWEDKTAIAFIHSNREIDKIVSKDYYGSIFSHDFAKAFVKYILPNNALTLVLFGNSDLIQKYSKGGILEEMAKDKLLTEMVLEKEPLQYLKKFL